MFDIFGPSPPPRSKDVVLAFLSCSIRTNDWPIVEAIERDVLRRMGFRCYTIGRNLSLIEHPDDAVKRLMGACECLVGIATERLLASDIDSPTNTLRLATPYLLEETSMAHQGGLPFLIFRTPEVSLQGVTARNSYLKVRPTLHNGKVQFIGKREMIHSALHDLKRKALAVRASRGRDTLLKTVGGISTFLVGGAVAGKALDIILRPDCFGGFDYRERECQACDYKPTCKVRKLQDRV